MSKKKKADEENALPPMPTEVEFLVVGGGPSGMAVFDASTENSKYLLESGDRLGGGAQAGLHLRPVVEGEFAYAPLKVRWDRKWMDANDVEWDDKDWAHSLPQWKFYFGQSMSLWSSAEAASRERSPEQFRLGTPVSAVDPVTDASRPLWRVKTPEGAIITPKLIWAAGMTAFQNAIGKIEAQRYMTQNPAYVAEAADARGGGGFDLILSEKPNFEEGFDASSVFGLPVRHNGKLYLCLGVYVPAVADAEGQVTGGGELRTLTHLPDEMLKDSKELLSFQKSVRRTLKMITTDDRLEIKSERWFVSQKVAGHMLGSPWLLNGSEDGSLVFAGDESVGSPETAAGAQALGLHV